MNHDKQTPPEPAGSATPAPAGQAQKPPVEADLDHRKPEDLSEEDLRLMADTMPGDSPGDD